MPFPSFNRKKKEMERELELLRLEKEAKERQDRWEREQTERDRIDKERQWQRAREQAEADREEFARRTRKQDEDHRRQLEALEYERAQRREKERQEEEMRRALEESRQMELYKEEQRREARRKLRAETTPEALRHLRDLVRTRYKLDMEIWSLRGSRTPDRPVVVEMMERSEAVLLEIFAIVDTWGDGSVWTPDEFKLAMTIKERIMKDNKRWWSRDPPWND